MKLKILDLFCGRGGWSVPFVEYGDEVVGIDIKKQPYPGQLIVADIKTVDGKQFKGFDLIIGSPPCEDFSNARYKSIHVHGKTPNPEKGLELINEFWRIIEEAEPEFYAMENIEALTKCYPVKPQWRFMISKGGKRCLWTNIPLPPIIPKFEFKHKIRDIHGWEKHRWKRSYIPYPIAKFIADLIHSVIEKKNIEWATSKYFMTPKTAM